MYKKYVIGCDPSGNFAEGKGHTGLCVLDREQDKVLWTGYTWAKKFDTWQQYYSATWSTIRMLFEKYGQEDCILSIEDYRLYAHKATAQYSSLLETPRIIGFILMMCWYHKYPHKIRCASPAKRRCPEEKLEEWGYIYKKGRSWYNTATDKRVVSHELDSIKHAVYCSRFELEEKNNGHK